MKPVSATLGSNISQVEVTHISSLGFWVLVDELEHFLPFDHFPWFRDATIAAIQNVERPHAGHLYWPQLDIDLAEASIQHPERYPLVARSVPAGQ